MRCRITTRFVRQCSLRNDSNASIVADFFRVRGPSSQNDHYVVRVPCIGHRLNRAVSLFSLFHFDNGYSSNCCQVHLGMLVAKRNSKRDRRRRAHLAICFTSCGFAITVSTYTRFKLAVTSIDKVPRGDRILADQSYVHRHEVEGAWSYRLIVFWGWSPLGLVLAS